MPGQGRICIAMKENDTFITGHNVDRSFFGHEGLQQVPKVNLLVAQFRVSQLEQLTDGRSKK